MVLAKEYRITLPVSVEEYRIAQVYMVSKMSKEQTGHGEGVEVVENRSYELDGHSGASEGAGSPDDNEKGHYTHKIYHIGSRLPGWLQAIAPTSALQVSEKAWNAYPYCKTVYSAPFLGDRFSITIVTRYIADDGTNPNALDLTEQQLKEREVDIIDIAFDPIDPNKYKIEEDPTLFTSQKTGRGKLTRNWQQTTQPIMTSYKHASVEFRYWGLQGRIESFIHQSALRATFLLGHRQAFCWIDEWFGLKMEDVRKIEEETQKELTTLLASTDENNTEGH